MFRRLAVLTALVLVMGGLGLAVQAQGGTGIVFQEDFSTDSGLWETGPRDSGERVIEGGQLRITDYDIYGTTSSRLDRSVEFQDGEIEFDTTLLSGNDRGWHVLLLRYQDSDNYHGLSFHAGGRVYGFTVLNGERTVWQANENFAAIHTGFGQVNHVRATASGTTLRFYINGELVTETDQPGPLAGRVGFSVSAQSGEYANGPTQVAFDNLVIRAPIADSGLEPAASDMTNTTIVFQDDFSTDSGAWVIGPRDSGERVIEGGQLRITDLDTRFTTTSYLEHTYADLDIEFDTMLRGGNERGWHVVYLRYQDKDNYHGFAFHAGGRVYGYTVLDGERTVWQESADSAAIRTGSGQVNHVRATASGTTLRFYINGELVAETNQAAPTEGRVALSVSAPSGEYANGPTEIAFDNVVIRTPIEVVDLTVLESVDYAAIAASIPPPVAPERIQQAGDNGAGLPAFLMYAFEPEEIAPGVFVDTTASWALSKTAIQPALDWDITNTSSSSASVDFIADIPKEFAGSASEIAFSVPPTEIIEDDPVVRWLLVMDGGLQRRIEANSFQLMSITDPENTLALLEGFQNQLKVINLRRQFQSCQRTFGPLLDQNICALTVILQNRQYIKLGMCDTFGNVTGEEDRIENVVFANACRNLLQPYDNLHCDFNETRERDACLTLTRSVLSTSCEGLTGVDRDVCLYDVAAYVGDLRGCNIVEDADMARDCRAQISGDPAYCADITDAARHDACCANFQADAALYAACMGDQQAGDEPIEEGETLTLDEVLGTGDSNTDAGDSVFGPLPAAPDLGYLMNDAFYAEYACDGQSERARFVTSGGMFFYAADTERTFPLPGNLASTMTQQGHDTFTTTSLFVLGSPGLWMPLDGSVYALPAVTEVWATDAESYDRYSALELRPAPDSVTAAGRTLDAVRYEGSYTDEVVIDDRDSTFVDGYFSSVDTITFRAWYDQRTGLLLKSHFQRQPMTCVRDGDYADEECPEPIDLVCTLVDTSLPLGQ